MQIRDGGLGFVQTLDNNDFKNKLRESMRGVTGFSTQAQSEIHGIQLGFNDLAKAATGFLSIQVARSFVQELVKVRGEFQSTEIAFNTMLQSQVKSKELMREMVSLAKETPLKFGEVAQGAKQLLAYQVEASDLTDKLRMLGDISAGLQVPLSRLILVYGQVKAKNRLMGDDLRQFTEAGVPMINMLAKQMGVADSAIQQMVSDGKIGFKDVEKALQNMTNEGGLFYNMMEAQSKSIPGQLAKLGDEVEQMFNKMGQASEGAIVTVISGAASVVENYESIGKTIGALIATYGAYKAAVMTMAVVNTTVGAELGALTFKEKLGMARLNRTKAESIAKLELTKTELANQQAILGTMRAEVSSLAVKKQKAIALKVENAQLAQNAQVQLATAQAELSTAQATGTARTVKIAQRNVEKAQNTVIAAQETAEISRKSSLATSQTFYATQQQLINQARRTKIAQTAISNAQDGVEVATKNLNTAATARLTLTQHAQALSAKAASMWQAFLNATMLANPIVLVVAAVGGLIAAYVLLADHTSDAEKAQKSFNESQEESKKVLDETKTKAEEYIGVLKDETATVYQQIKAYQSLVDLRLLELEGLTMEQVQTMDLIELRKLLNKSLDSKSLNSDKDKLDELSKSIEKAKANIHKFNDAAKNGLYVNNSLLSEAKSRLAQLTYEYNSQLNLVVQKDREQKLANMTKAEELQYWIDIKKEGEEQLKNNSRIIDAQNKQNDNVLTYKGHQLATNSIVGDMLKLSNDVGDSLFSWDISRATSQIEEAAGNILRIKNATVGGEETVKNKPYWEKEKSDATELFEKALPNSEEWVKQRKRIDEANNALKAWDTTVKKAAKPKSKPKPKKADDPAEIFKKQLSDVKGDYDRFNKWIDSNDTFLSKGAKDIFEKSLAKKGNTYLDYLRKLQEELVASSDKTELNRKKLLAVSDELAKEIDFSVIEEFKKKTDKEIENAKSLLEVVNILNEAQKGLGSNQEGVDKKKYLDEKMKQNAEDIDRATKQLVSENQNGYDELIALKEKYNSDYALLEKGANEAELAMNSAKLANDEQAYQKQYAAYLNYVDAMNKLGESYYKDTNGKSGNKDLDNILNESKSLIQKRVDIEKEANEKIAVIRSAVTSSTSEAQIEVFNNSISVIEEKQKEALAAIDKEIREKSQGWIQIFGDYANKSSKELIKILDKIRVVLNDPNSGLDPASLKALQDQFEGISAKLQENNPFEALKYKFNLFIEDAKKGFKDLDGSISFDSLKGLLDSARKGFDEVFDIAEGLGISVSDSTKEAIELGLDLLEAGTMIAEGIASKDPVKIIQGVAKAIGSIFKAKDKRLERQIKNYQKAVNALTLAFNDLEYATSKALGGDSYKNQKGMMDNLEKQNAEIDKMIQKEKRKKKKDNGKIAEWEKQKIENARKSKEIMEDLAQDILQTNAKDLSSTLGDALVEAFGKGEDAALAFEKVANDVLKNAIINQLKKKFLEDQLKGALDKLYSDMGGKGDGSVDFQALTPEQQQEFRNKIKEISSGYLGALEAYSGLFEDMLPDPNEDALVGAIKGVSEETAGLIAGHMNAIRILSDLTNKIVTDSNTFLKEGNFLMKESNAILRNCLTELTTIAYNTSYNKRLEDIYQHLTSNNDNGRAHGF